MLYLLPLLLWLTAPAYAFVENVPHGYQNCMACHVSPSGGGVLTEYGRGLSKELMSTWNWKNSEKALFGAIPENDNLRVGGDVRSVQTFFENKQVARGMYFIMQNNLEVAYKAAQVWWVATFGTQQGPKGTPNRGEFLSERHYALYQPAEDFTVRAGKFRIHYGINDPNHTRVTKTALGFGALTETYNLEAAKFGEKYEVFVTAGLGRIDQPRDTLSEKSLSTNVGYHYTENSKVGGSAFLGDNLNQRRFLTGLWTISKVWENGVVIAELDWQKSHLATRPDTAKNLIAGHARLGHAVYKGIMPYVLYEHLQSDLKDKRTRKQSPGLGLQLLPFPHMEVQAEYLRQQIEPYQINHSGWVMMHFYL